MKEIGIRDAQAWDESFIYATWLNSYKNNSPHAKRIRHDVFFKNHHDIVEKILADERTKVLIATLKDDPNVTLGYAVFNSDTIHYLFVKEAWRQLGIAKALVEAGGPSLAPVKFTHWTYIIGDMVLKYPDFIYNPYDVPR